MSITLPGTQKFSQRINLLIITDFSSCSILTAFATKQDNRVQCNGIKTSVHSLYLCNLVFIFLSKDEAPPHWSFKFLIQTLPHSCFLLLLLVVFKSWIWGGIVGIFLVICQVEWNYIKSTTLPWHFDKFSEGWPALFIWWCDLKFDWLSHLRFLIWFCLFTYSESLTRIASSESNPFHNLVCPI